MTIRFRRNTHDLAGNYREECQHIKPIPPGEMDPMHWITPRANGDSFDEVVANMQGDRTNFMDLTGPEGECDDRERFPSIQDVAVGLVRLLECGIAEVVQAKEAT